MPINLTLLCDRCRNVIPADNNCVYRVWINKYLPGHFFCDQCQEDRASYETHDLHKTSISSAEILREIANNILV